MKTIDRIEIPNFANVKYKVDDENNEVKPVLMFIVKSESEATEEQWQKVQQVINRYHQDKKNCRLIVDLSKSTMVFSLPYIQKWSEFFKINRNYLKEHVSYVSFISDNILINNMIKVAISLNPSKIPFHVVRDKREALSL